MTKIFTKEENQIWVNKLPGKMCSACVALVSSGKVLMVKASYKTYWTFPGGIVEKNEAPKIAAIRETAEEIGLTINSKDCDLFTIVYTAGTDEDRDRFNFVFITESFTMDAKLSAPNEEIEKTEWVDFSEIAERSENRPSYVNIQRMLLDVTAHVPYVEVLPMN